MQHTEAASMLITAPLKGGRGQPHDFWGSLRRSGPGCPFHDCDHASRNSPTGRASVCCLSRPRLLPEQAGRFRQLAAAVSGDELANQMMKLAAAYESKAAQLEAQTM